MRTNFLVHLEVPHATSLINLLLKLEASPCLARGETKTFNVRHGNIRVNGANTVLGPFQSLWNQKVGGAIKVEVANRCLNSTFVSQDLRLVDCTQFLLKSLFGLESNHDRNIDSENLACYAIPNFVYFYTLLSFIKI